MRIVESVLESAALYPPRLLTDPTPLTGLTDPPPRIILPTSRVRPPGSWLRVVERRRLLDRVSQVIAHTPFTLISAPAGYGKTVLASEWAGSRAPHVRPAAWLTVSDQDNQPGVFWCHVFIALAFVGAVAADAPLPMVGTTPAVDELGELLLEAGGLAVLVLDAADRLRNPTIFDQLGRLLEGAGERLRLVMTTRADPPMPLHRYRLEGTLAEIRHDEIAFNRNEVEGLLNLHGLALPDASVADVVERTEGWAAGVRLAALALQAGGDHARLHWLTAEYLAAEVLSDLTSADREFLITVSLFDEIPAGLASEISGRADADLLLRQMSLRNTFVQPVRGRFGYYRVHPLMRAVLAKELPRDLPAAGVDVRSRAADSFDMHGQLETAVEHAAAGGDWLRAARFVVRSLAIGDLLLSTATGSQLTGHLSGMPDVASPDVHLVRAALDGGRGELESARAGLGQCLTDASTSEDWLISVAVLRTWLSAASGNVVDTLLAARAAREHMMRQAGRADAQLQLLQALVLSSEGMAHLRAGDLEAAARALRDASRAAGGGTSEDLRLYCLATLALAEVLRGQLSAGQELLQSAERLAEEIGVPASRLPASLPLADAWVALERQELSKAQHLLGRAVRLQEIGDDALLCAVSALLQARLMRDRGDRAGAREILEKVEPRVGWLRGYLDGEAAALGLVGPRPALRPDHEAQSETGGCRRGPGTVTTAHRIQELLKHAQVKRAAGDVGGGRFEVATALSLGAHERIRRPFAHLPAEIRSMIRTDPELMSCADWLRPEPAAAAIQPARPTQVAALLGPNLTARELEVLRLLSSLLTTEEIAAELFISVNTVRTHVRRIFEKLCVSRRNDAVRRARELKLV
jgi:LuxR family maltose regulon positive regulatory protein